MRCYKAWDVDTVKGEPILVEAQSKAVCRP